MDSEKDTIYVVDALPPPFENVVAHKQIEGHIPPPSRKTSVVVVVKSTHISEKSVNQDNDAEAKNSEQPPDRYYFVLFVVTLLGMIHVLPYTFFMTANEYWMYKFRNTTSNSTSADDRTYLQTNFASLNQLYTTVPTVLTTFLLTFFAHKIPPMSRILFTLSFHTLIFSVEAVFVKINTDDWQQEFFYITILTLIMVHSTISFGAASQFGLFSKLPPIYLQYYLVGEGCAAIFNSTMRLLSVIILPSATGSALIYFVTGSTLMLLSTILTYISSKTDYFKYHNRESEANTKEKVRDIKELLAMAKSLVNIIIVNGMFVFVPLGSVFNLVVSEYNGDSNNVWANVYFVTVCSFLIPSIMHTVGRALYNKFDWNCRIPIIYIIVILYDIYSGTFIFFSNAKPRYHLPVIVTHDWQYALVMASYSVANGFIASLLVMKTIRSIPDNRVEMGMLVAMFFASIVSVAFSPLGVLAVKLL